MAGCLAMPVGAQDTGGTSTPDSGFDDIEADLQGQLFTETLPFDVPFVIFGKVPTGAKSLEIRCWKLDSSANGGKRKRKSGEPVRFNMAELKEKAPDGDCWAGGPLVWRNTIDPAAKNPTFRVLAPRLEAESYYTFEFRYQREVTEPEATAFAQKVQAVVSRVLWGDPRSNPQISSPEQLPLQGPLSSEELRVICEELRAALKEITGADRIVDPGSVFSDEKSCADVVELFNVRLRSLRERQLKIFERIPDYRNRVSNINSLLPRVRNDSTLLKLQQVLASQAASNPSLQHHAATVSNALTVPDLPVLKPEDRKNQETLTSFVTQAMPAVADAEGKLTALSDLLGKQLFNADGSPVDFLKSLVDASALTATDLDALRKLADPMSEPRRAARAVKGAASVLAGLQSELKARTDAVADLAEDYKTEVVGLVILAGSTTGSFATQHKNYVSADTGLAYAPELDEFPTYVGTNIYFRPVNKAAPLNQFGGFFDTLSRRVSVTIGLTAQGVGDDGKTRKDLFNKQSLILGIGARMTNSVRLTVGGLVFLETAPNPLEDNDQEAITPFLSLSFDIDVVPTLQGIGGLFKAGNPK